VIENKDKKRTCFAEKCCTPSMLADVECDRFALLHDLMTKPKPFGNLLFYNVYYDQFTGSNLQPNETTACLWLMAAYKLSTAVNASNAMRVSADGCRQRAINIIKEHSYDLSTLTHHHVFKKDELSAIQSQILLVNTHN
jgi:hypothetical protein